jgi:vacuolar-type H+-ATPase subunit E/Vma4
MICVVFLIAAFPDCRTGNNTKYSMEDIGLAAFSVFYNQNPSFLAHQKVMHKKKSQNNARTLFGIDKIPCDNHIRNQLDPVSAKYLFPLFDSAVRRLNYWGHLDSFRSDSNNLLLAIDGTQYFASKQVHCKNCKEHKNGTKTYSHAVITSVFVAPGNDKVISLAPEFITPQDGHQKQDCENAACKRWLNEYAPRYKQLGITVLGDDLYCKQPIRTLILEHELNFILVCKPDSHQTLYQWLKGLETRRAIETVVEKRWTGKNTKLILTGVGMGTELQPLIDRIYTEAIERGQQEADNIVSKARDKAAAIVREAEKRKQEILDQAKQDAELYTKRSQTTLEQAARDVLILVSQGIEDILAEIVTDSVHQAMDIHTLQRMLVAIAHACGVNPEETRLEYLVSPQDHEALVNYFASLYEQKMIKGVQLKVDENITKGFKVSFRENHVFLDFTAEAVAEALNQLLRPELGRIVKRVVDEDASLEAHCTRLLSRQKEQ